MLKLQRSPQNPILLPSIKNEWERGGTFNGSVVKTPDGYFMVYRAITPKKFFLDANIQVSTIGGTKSTDGINFTDHFQLIKPSEDFDKYGCEDPRITYMDGKYYIFYTALSGYPFSAENIKVAVAISTDLKTIEEKHLVTPFNAKATGLFPEKIKGKYVLFLTANTDIPPAKIGIAQSPKIEDFWNKDYWDEWKKNLDAQSLPLLRHSRDQIEAGAVPVLTDEGFIFIYSLIRNYFSNDKIFTIEAVLLDKGNPLSILKRTENALLTPEEEYESYGNIPNVVFPTGAQIIDDKFLVYYGAADTTCAVASCPLPELFEVLKPTRDESEVKPQVTFSRIGEKPLMMPVPEHSWESQAVFNPAALLENGRVHILYRALGQDNMSSIGYAASTDGEHIDERLPYPIYTPREPFEMKQKEGNYGCEDPRIVRIEDIIYMCYTAFDGGNNPPRVALTTISYGDFINSRWNWSQPILISPPHIDDKDASLFPKKIKGKFVFLHRINEDIWIDFKDNTNFIEGKYLDGAILMHPRIDNWDRKKIGISSPPIETEDGWLLLYHGLSETGIYKVGACLLDKNQPDTILSRLPYPIFEPREEWEKEGIVPNVVFPCGSVVIDNTLYIYYGGADKVLGGAKINLEDLLSELAKHRI